MNKVGCRMTTTMRARAAACCALVLFGGTADAQSLDWSVSVGATHSDNARRTATDEVSDTRGELGVNLSYVKEEGRLTARVSSNLQYRSYFDDTYDDELFGSLDGLVTYWFIPERVSWVVEDNYGQTLIDRAAVDTPDNRQQSNYFSTGPDINFMVGDRTGVLLQGRWSDVSYETSNASHQRLEGTIGLVRYLNERTYLSLNADAGRYEFDDPDVSPGYDRQSAYLELQAQGARTELQLQGGYTALHDFGETIDGPLFDLSISRETSVRSRLALRAGTRLTDSADMFRLDQGIGRDAGSGGGVLEDRATDVQISAEPFQSDYASLGWRIEGQRNTFSVSVDWRNEDYTVDDSQNRESFGGSATFSRQLAPSLSGRLFGYWRTEDLANADIDYDESSAGVGLDWQFAQRLSLGMDVTRFKGSDNASAVSAVRDYVENRYALRVNYHPGR